MRLQVVRLMAVTLLVMAPGTGIRAEDGRDFAGTWRVAEVVDGGASVTVTLDVRVTNHSGSDIGAATVFVSGGAGTADVGAFPPTDLPYQQPVSLSGAFEVSVDEWQEWQHGRGPSLSVEFLDGDGDTQRRPVELIGLGVAGGEV